MGPVPAREEEMGGVEREEGGMAVRYPSCCDGQGFDAAIPHVVYALRVIIEIRYYIIPALPISRFLTAQSQKKAFASCISGRNKIPTQVNPLYS